MSAMKLYEIPPSPNNVKVRIALAYKGLEAESKPLFFETYPGDRTEIVEVSGQPLTPVLVDGETVVFDSNAILRYLDANYRDTPPLYSTDVDAMREIEDWEGFAKTQLGESVGMVFGQAMAPQPDAAVLQRANEVLHEATGRIENRLAEGEFLVGDKLSAADVVCAPLLRLSVLPAPTGGGNPIEAFFATHLKLGEGRDRTRAWLQRVLAYAPAPASA